MGGEKSTGLDATSETIGSPPRGRRKVVEMWQSASDPGITPAWAGKSLCCCLVHRFPGDHPRMGGEKPFLFYGGSSDSGSPPHGRGKVHVLCLKGGNVGITPAWAGKSVISKAFANNHRDHPRMGGEKPRSYERGLFIVGSPPHGRGKALPEAQPDDVEKITPAWAGKSEVSKYAAKPGEDHPRVGGEKIIWASVSIAALESPPHGRGKAAAFDDNGYVNRITPAWAGKSCSLRLLNQPNWDHPRMGGEKAH